MNTETQTTAQDWRQQYRDIEKQVSDALSAAGITYAAVLVQKGAVSQDSGEKPWTHDAWRLTFTRAGREPFALDFKTGTGLRKETKYTGAQPVAPVAASVVHSICMDDTHGADFELWAADFGYSADSIKALDTYLACQKQTRAAMQFFGRELFAKLAELTQEY